MRKMMWGSSFAVAAAIAVSGCGVSEQCGDGIQTARETCDDGNTQSGDGCGFSCFIEPGWACAEDGCDPVCNDSMLVSAEVCDPSVAEWSDYCSADCLMRTGSCGDLTRQSREACDDGNTDPRDGCTAQCGAAFGWRCRDGVCDASMADPTTTINMLQGAELTAFCTWLTNMLGGPGHVTNCPGTQITTYSVARCEMNITDLVGSSVGECTVADFERQAAEATSICTYFADTRPACMP